EKYDSLSFHFKAGAYEKTHTVTTRNVKPIDSLQIKFLKRGMLQFRDTVAVSTNTPIESINNEWIKLIQKDSTQVAFTTRIDSLNNAVKIQFDWKEEENYTLSLLPGSITDFYGKSVNDTITQLFQTGKISDYGNLSFELSGEIQYPIIFELLTPDEKRYDDRYFSEPQPIEFKLIEPGKYFVRIIEDVNGNRKWDTGNYLEKRPPEKVINFPKELDLRANWELNETLIVP